MFVGNNADGYGYGCNSGPGFGSLDSWLSKAVKKVSKATTALLKNPVGTVVNTIVSPVKTTTALLKNPVGTVVNATVSPVKNPVGTVVNTIVSPVGTTTALWNTTGYNLGNPVKTATPPIEYTQIAQAAATQQTVPNAPIPTPIQAAQAATIVNAAIPAPTIAQIGAVAQQIAESKVVTVPQPPTTSGVVELPLPGPPHPSTYVLWGGAVLLLVLALRK